MRINNNLTALNTSNQLLKIEQKIAKRFEKLSSGKRINRGADDAAGLAISQKMQAQIRGTKQADRNIDDGISLIQTAEGGLQEVHTILQRMRELCIQASNGILTDAERGKLNDEIWELKGVIDHIANNTKFNGMNILNSEGLVTLTTETVPITTMVKTYVTENHDFSVPDIASLTPAEQAAIQADIVFVVDHTGSMGDNIQNVIENLDKFIERFAGTDVRIGLVTYSDDNLVKYDLGMSKDDFKATLQSLPLVGGYEYALEALKDHAATLSFRPGAQKHMILLTDEPAETKSGYLIGDVATELDSQDFVVDVIAPAGDPYGLGVLSSTTGGTYTDIYNPYFRENLYGILNDIVEEAIGVAPSTITVTEEVQKVTYTPQVSQELRTVEVVTPLKLQVGPDGGQTYDIRLCDTRTATIGVNDVSTATQANAENSIGKLDTAIDLVSTYRTRFGAYQNALEHTKNNVANYGENLTAATSRIEDADMALEIMDLTKQQILQQAGQAMLAQANMLPQSILKILS